MSQILVAPLQVPDSLKSLYIGVLFREYGAVCLYID